MKVLIPLYGVLEQIIVPDEKYLPRGSKTDFDTHLPLARTAVKNSAIDTAGNLIILTSSPLNRFLFLGYTTNHNLREG